MWIALDTEFPVRRFDIDAVNIQIIRAADLRSVKLTAADKEVNKSVHKRKPRCDYVLA
jgi:hypothetical protein